MRFRRTLVVQLRRAGASRVVAVLLVMAGVGLAIAHPFPTGTIAMAGLLVAGIVWERARLRPGD
jgi:1,4-dihydroxy-2-naphthoate octaprenyltransferase